MRLMQVEAVILFFALFAPALADLAKGKQALKNGDYATALNELLPLARQGDPDAECYLGSLYSIGKGGVTQDYVEAVRWYRKAADQGQVEAQETLGSMYERGLGVPQDYIRAHMWFNLAGANGNADAIKERDNVASKMTPEQIAEAQRLAREWTPTIHAADTAGGRVTARAEEGPSQAQEGLSDDDLRTLIAYGQTFHKPDQLYQGGGLPESVLVDVSSGRTVRFMTDRASICIEACRAKLLLKPFGIAEARAIFDPNRLHAILEATSATRNGAARANKQFGGQDLNLILSIGGEMLQPQTIGGPAGGIGAGVQLTQVSRVGRGFYTVNTIDLTPGFLSRAFTFELPSPVADVTAVNFILVDSKGKQKRFSTNLLPLRADNGTRPGITFDYPLNGTTKPGKPFSFRVRMDPGQGASKVMRADSIWRAPEAKGAQATKIKDLPPESVFSFQSGDLYTLELPTDGLVPGRYQLHVLVGAHVTTLFFGIRE